jgi:hypothetical protein
MRIISQSGLKDCEYNGNLLELELTKDGGMLFREKMYGRTLGEYSSKEKALKVMDLIRKADMVDNTEIEYFNENFEGQILDFLVTSIGTVKKISYFYMPQDNQL